MKREFRIPVFGERHVEIRCEENEVYIYATETGLQKLIGLCTQLLENPGRSHIHLEDYEILTADSLQGTIAIFLADVDNKPLE